MGTWISSHVCFLSLEKSACIFESFEDKITAESAREAHVFRNMCTRKHKWTFMHDLDKSLICV